MKVYLLSLCALLFPAPTHAEALPRDAGEMGRCLAVGAVDSCAALGARCKKPGRGRVSHGRWGATQAA
ncbi:MAG: hypothetical protein LPK18_07060 [Pseudomonadaceae bacterium]|nr:hypothetical protein [Pseudomonadaceae bacterium]